MQESRNNKEHLWKSYIINLSEQQIRVRITVDDIG